MMAERYRDSDVGRMDIKARLSIPGVDIELREDLFHRAVESVISGNDVRLTLIHSNASWDGCFYTGGGPLRYAPSGNVFLEPPDIPFHARGTIGHFRVIRCCFTQDPFQETTGIGDWGELELSSCLNIKEPSVVSALNRLAREALEPGFASDVLVDSVATWIMIELSRYLQRSKDRDSGGPSKMTAWQLRQTMDYINDRYGLPLTVAELADQRGFSPRHLQRVFKSTTGQSVHGCIEQIRMQKARALLSDGDASIKQIAAQVGFSGTASFSAAFRRATGETPGSFRRQSAGVEGNRRSTA